MSFGIYIVGYLIVIGGLAYGATLMHVPTHWIVGRRHRAYRNRVGDRGSGDPAEGLELMPSIRHPRRLT